MATKVSRLEAAALKELSERENMALRVFRPQVHQEPIYHQPRAKYMAIGGGNRGGKTISATALTSAIALDEKITFLDGTSLDMRMPWQKGRTLTIWLVCIDQRHIGDVLYPALFKAGMFNVAYDPTTKSLRTYNPDTDKDVRPKPSPPFIPARYVESFSWECKADNIFNRVTIRDPSTKKTLANIHAFTSKGDAPQGRAVDFIFVDEQLAKENYVDELKTRLVDKDGQIVWSSWNDEDSSDLAKFNAIIDRELELGSGVAKRVSLSMEDNKSLGRKAIADFRAGCATEEEWQQRNTGAPPSEKIRMYPAFDKQIHTALIDGEEEDALSATLRLTDGIPPDTWTKTMVLDPGTSHPAVLLCAVPPPEFGDYMVAYQEIYPGNADPLQLASIVHQQCGRQRFYRMIADMRAGRQQTMGLSYNTRVIDMYETAWAKYKITCKTTGGRFAKACDDVGGRQLILLSWLHPGKSPYPKLRIVTHRCPSLVEQMRKVKKRVVQREVNDERKVRGQWDSLDCLEYFAASNPRYVPQTITTQDGSPAYQRYMKKFGNKTARPVVTFGVH
jgi:hypothetical protein